MRYSNRWDTVFVDEWRRAFPDIYVATSFTQVTKKPPPVWQRLLLIPVNYRRYYLAASKRLVTSAQFTTFQNAAI